MYQEKESIQSIVESIVSQIEVPEGSWDTIHTDVNGHQVVLDIAELARGEGYSDSCFRALYSAAKVALPYDSEDTGYFAECDTREVLYATLKELAERVYDAHADLFSEETLDFIRSSSDDVVGTWIADKLKDPSDDDGNVGANWCAGCARSRGYGCYIENTFLCINLCNEQHGTKGSYISSQLRYALPRDLRPRSGSIAGVAYNETAYA